MEKVHPTNCVQDRKKMTAEEKLIPLLRRAANVWIFLGHKDIWDSDDYTDDLGVFCNNVADCLTNGALTENDAKKVWMIFAPTCEWDDSVGDVELGNQIFSLLDSLYGTQVLKKQKPHNQRVHSIAGSAAQSDANR